VKLSQKYTGQYIHIYNFNVFICLMTSIFAVIYRLKIFCVEQTLMVLLATAGAVMSIKNFNNSFNNYHQRIGVALYAIIWLQALVGFVRPKR
jgi:hypothetical protein